MRPSIAALAWLLLASSAAAEKPESDTLIVALDGVPYRVVRRAWEQGAFADWPGPRPLVSSFPSVTNVGFVAILSPLGAERMSGYELRHFDPEQNRIRGGGPVGYRKQAGSWRERFDVQDRTLRSKATVYVVPHHHVLKEWEKVEQTVLREPSSPILALVSATDALMHFRGDGAAVNLLVDLSQRIEVLQRERERRFGRPLRVVLLSDHGNGGGKIRIPGGLRRALRTAGLRPSKHLSAETDVVPVTYGVCGYGSLYVDPRLAERAARAVLEAQGVELAAWIVAPGELRVVSRLGEGVVRWQGAPGQRRMSYEARGGDPLRLQDSVERLAATGRLDEHGSADERDWFVASAAAPFPGVPIRLIDALDGRFVRHPATVMFSLAPGYAWGIRSARLGAWLFGGRLEATHGGLDRESTLGFYLRSDDDGLTGALPAEQALVEWGDADRLREAFAGLATASDPLHGARIGAP